MCYGEKMIVVTDTQQPGKFSSYIFVSNTKLHYIQVLNAGINHADCPVPDYVINL